MKTSLPTRKLISSQFVWTAVGGLLVTTLLVPSYCGAQEATGVDRLRSMLQHVDVEHSPSACATSAILLDSGFASASVKQSVKQLVEPVPENGFQHTPPLPMEHDFGLQPELVENSSIPFSPTPAMLVEPNFHEQEYGPVPYGYEQASVSSLGYSYADPILNSTRPIHVSEASRLWDSYCDACNQCDSIHRKCGCRSCQLLGSTSEEWVPVNEFEFAQSEIAHSKAVQPEPAPAQSQVVQSQNKRVLRPIVQVASPTDEW